MTPTLQLYGIRDPRALVQAFIDRGQITVGVSISSDPANLEANRRWRERNRANGLTGRGQEWRNRAYKKRYRDKLKAIRLGLDSSLRIRPYVKRNGLSKNRKAYMVLWRSEKRAKPA